MRKSISAFLAFLFATLTLATLTAPGAYAAPPAIPPTPITSATIANSGGALLGGNPKLGFVATNARFNYILSTTAKQFSTRTYHVARDNISAVKVAWQDFSVTSATSFTEQGLGSNGTVTASVEYPAGTFTQLTFSGAAQGTVPNGSFLFSDLVQLTVPIPRGAIFWIRSYQTNPSGMMFDTQGYTGSGYDSSEYGASGITDKTMGGTISGGNNAYVSHPIAIVGYTTRPSILLIGDSRVNGYQDTADFTDNTAYNRTISRYYGSMNLGVPSDRASYYMNNNTQRSQFYQYATYVICNYGINDFLNGITYGTVISDLQIIYSHIPVPVYGMTLEPITTSTDGWATTTNQTKSTWDLQRTTFNNIRRAGGIAGESGYFEIADLAETARNSGYWKNPASGGFVFTPDGIHANQAGYMYYAANEATGVQPWMLRVLIAP